MDSEEAEDKLLDKLRKLPEEANWIVPESEEYGLVETDPIIMLMKKIGYTMPTKQPKSMRWSEEP